MWDSKVRQGEVEIAWKQCFSLFSFKWRLKTYNSQKKEEEAFKEATLYDIKSYSKFILLILIILNTSELYSKKKTRIKKKLTILKSWYFDRSI